MSGVIEIWHGVPVRVALAPVASNVPVKSVWVSADGHLRKIEVLAVDETEATVRYKDLQNFQRYEKPMDRFFQQFHQLAN